MFLIINDVFLLMDQGKTPSDEYTETVDKLCTLKCANYKFEDIVIDETKINRCCKLTNEFVSEITINKMVLNLSDKGQQVLLIL